MIRKYIYIIYIYIYIGHIVIGRFRKHNATSNRDVTCLGMAWARLPLNREVVRA